jgi:hypothetical protein
MLLLSGLYTSISILQKMKKNNAEALNPRPFFRCQLSAAGQDCVRNILAKLEISLG